MEAGEIQGQDKLCTVRSLRMEYSTPLGSDTTSHAFSINVQSLRDIKPESDASDIQFL